MNNQLHMDPELVPDISHLWNTINRAEHHLLRRTLLPMNEKTANVPLSPPESPCMLHQAGANLHTLRSRESQVGSCRTTDHIRPPFKTHQTLPYSLERFIRQQDDIQDEPNSTSTLTLSLDQTTGSDQRLHTFGRSAHTSAEERVPRLSPAVDSDGAIEEDEDIVLDDATPDFEEERLPMTAAELRAHKRKMKRFRQATEDVV